MSVLIKGMGKPEHCGYCRFRYDGICHALQKTQYSMNECPLVVIDDAGLNDTISRQAAIAHAISGRTRELDGEKWIRVSEVRESLQTMPSAQQWIPFETREPDAEEKEDHPEWEYVLCGNLPDDGQRILVNIKYKGHEAVQMDEYMDDGGYCYLDSGYDIGTEATAWMPLPEPYKGREDK